MNIEGEEQTGTLSAYEPQTESLENRHEILNLLDRLIHHRAIITLRQPGSNLEYPSAIFRIDESNNRLYLDEIAADKIEYPLMVGEQLQVRGQWNGGTVIFHETVTELGEEDGYSFYLLPIPQQLQFRQRRKS
jgi:c-di-GMP-binding flagellar brake protein YcgR